MFFGDVPCIENFRIVKKKKKTKIKTKEKKFLVEKPQQSQNPKLLVKNHNNPKNPKFLFFRW